MNSTEIICNNFSVTSIVEKGTGFDFGVIDQFGYEPNEFWVAKTEHLINESSTVQMTIMFDGSLQDGIVGFYKAYYNNGEK